MSERDRARRVALRAAVVVTLGLAPIASGCERVTAVACGTFENNRYCCEHHAHGMWNERLRTCEPIAIPGPFVPPDLPV